MCGLRWRYDVAMSSEVSMRIAGVKFDASHGEVGRRVRRLALHARGALSLTGRHWPISGSTSHATPFGHCSDDAHRMAIAKD